MMTVLATLGNPPHFEVSRIDIDREGVSYTIDTLHILREQYGPGCELFFITGADAVFEIIDWKDSDQLLRIAHFIAASRPGFPWKTTAGYAKMGGRASGSLPCAQSPRHGHFLHRYPQPGALRPFHPVFSAEQVEHYIRRHRLYE